MGMHYLLSMTPILEAEASLTAQNQITVPAPIRKALRLKGGRSRLKFQILPGTGQVMVVSADPDPMDTDTILAPFLRSLAGDMKKNPRRIKPFPVKLIERARNVVAEVDVDLDAPLTGED